MKHSELPWEANGRKISNDDKSQKIGECYNTYAMGGVLLRKGEANAQFIVKACNNHYKLLEALKEMYDTSCANATSTPSKRAFLKAQQAIKEAE